mmetsp:Transcript_44750/g.93894  ORF Transcript_44750/g.93894 Transcript_44750/m.93894 type:complete len:233 (+) Transcript_44750:632-1330(+)
MNRRRRMGCQIFDPSCMRSELFFRSPRPCNVGIIIIVFFVGSWRRRRRRRIILVIIIHCCLRLFVFVSLLSPYGEEAISPARQEIVLWILLPSVVVIIIIIILRTTLQIIHNAGRHDHHGKDWIWFQYQASVGIVHVANVYLFQKSIIVVAAVVFVVVVLFLDTIIMCGGQCDLFDLASFRPNIVRITIRRGSSIFGDGRGGNRKHARDAHFGKVGDAMHHHHRLFLRILQP